MADVLSRARELIQNAGADEAWKASIQKALAERLSQLASAAGAEEVSDADSVLVHFREHANRLASFSTQGGWPLQQPTAGDLANAGFFFAPLPGCEDRVACHACGKVLFNWDPDDVIADAHKLFSPDCPLLTGAPLPTAQPKPDQKPSWVVGEDKKGVNNLSANLSSFVESLRQTANSVDVEELVKRGRRKEEPQGFPTAQLVSDSEQASDTDNNAARSDEDTLVSRRHEGNRKKKPPSPESAAPTAQHTPVSGAIKRAERLWRFDWTVPESATREGGSILDAQAGELEMRLATASKMMLEQKDDWAAAGIRVETACREIEASFSGRMAVAGERLTEFEGRAGALARRVQLVRDDEGLRQRAEELAQMRREGEELAAVKKGMEEELAELRRQTAAERADIDLIKDKVATIAWLDGELEGKESRAAAAEDRADAAERRAGEAAQRCAEMEETLVAVRDELRDEISGLHQRKLEEESALAEASEQMLRVKRLYTEYKERLGELQRREALCETREAEMRSREEHVSRRENTLKAREEWMAKRETEFRIQQRALENNLAIPRNTSRDGSGHGGVGGGGSGGASGEGGSQSGSLAEQVLQAQADYALRPNQGMGMPVSGKGKAGAKEAAQRDYKAILSTNDMVDPLVEREAAKASRRKEIMKMIPGLGKRSSSKGGKQPAASFFDMNAI